MHPNCINDPFVGFYQGAPIGISFAHVLEDELIVFDADADCNEVGMAVDADTIGFKNLYNGPLVKTTV